MRIIVRVPATTANLGPGFDCMGLALQLWNTITVQEAPRAEVRWQDCTGATAAGLLPEPRDNLVLLSMNQLFGRAGLSRPRLRVTIRNCIPIGRGLGSSAAAIVGGLVAANAWAGGPFSEQQLLEFATEMEGHPDNVAAALRGGLQIAGREGEATLAAAVRPPRGWRAVLFIPERRLPTQLARKVLPSRLTRADAVYNISRAALLVRAFALRDLFSLDLAMRDRLHQPYRLSLVPGMQELIAAAGRAGAHGAALSGAGPSLIAFAGDDRSARRVARAFSRCAAELQIAGSARVLALSPRGARARQA